MKQPDENQKTMVSDFTTFLYQKGYRGKFRLRQLNAGRVQTTGSLRNCLEVLFGDYQQGGKTDPAFQLSTYADGANKIECTFQMKVDEVKGFLIKELLIADSISNSNKHYRFVNNQQVPGSVAVQGLFPKPKPWDNHLKGKFRR